LTGPTSVDIEDKEDTSATSVGFESIIGQAKENVPAIPFNKTITSFCGLRAVGSTGDFIINSPKRGIMNLGGIESPGLTSAPAIAEYIVELLKEQGMELLPKENYNPIREPQHSFKEASMDEKNEMIKKDKSFGKIVCRCETVTEGEILRAIRTNPGARDLDGVKRRTRAQMGRCQGGFCGPQIVELLAKELGISYEAVTKSGEGSYINIGRTKEV
jgi:glycerol-3-phosphate dehydrogenase